MMANYEMVEFIAALMQQLIDKFTINFSKEKLIWVTLFFLFSKLKGLEF